MKSLLKIIPFVSLILPLCTSLSAFGSGSGFGLPSIGQDTSNLNTKVRVDSFLLPVIAPSSGVHFFRDKIMFLSLTKNERKMTPNHISFGSVDTYYATIEDSAAGNHIVFSTFFPFEFPVEAITFNHSYDTIYFTKLADNDKSKIFMAKYSAAGKPGITGGIAPLEFCKGLYNYSHPSLSADGKTMVFASDNGSSIGGMDLFITRKTIYGWGVPENMGNLINTPGNEFFPFLDQDNNLYFSSDGMKGLGGYDIFTSKFNGKGWDKPVNLSNSINSKYDDIAFTMNSIDGKTAFFTRRSGKNDLQLFRIKVKHNNNNLLSIFNGNPVPKALLAVAAKEEKPQPSSVTPATTKPETTPEKKPEKKSSALNPGVKNTTPNAGAKSTSQKPAVAAVLPSGTTDAKYVTIKPTLPVPDNQKDIVIFRVQITTSDKPRKDMEVVVNSKSYPLFEYYYLGAYRYCIGEFTTLQSAVELQNICRKAAFPQAFVAGFKNNTRAMDLKSFK
jgi:hypothetical protein